MLVRYIRNLYHESVSTMAETNITLLDQTSVDQRVEAGLMRPYDSLEEINYTDCGDDRSLTDPILERRIDQHGADILPVRLYGAATGLAAATLACLVMSNGEASLKQFKRTINAETLADLAADIADKGYQQFGIDINQHSAVANEANETGLAGPGEVSGSVGCAYANLIGGVILSATSEHVLREGERIDRLAGTQLDLGEARAALQVVSQHVDPATSIHRGALRYAAARSGLHVPQAMVAGDHANNSEVQVVFDMHGYASDAQAHIKAGLPRYHHTPPVAGALLPELFPSYADSQAATASSVLLGSATRFALSGAKPHELAIEVIPSDRQAA